MEKDTCTQAITALLAVGLLWPGSSWAQEAPPAEGRAGVTRPAPEGKAGVTRPAGKDPHDDEGHEHGGAGVGPAGGAGGGQSAAPS